MVVVIDFIFCSWVKERKTDCGYIDSLWLKNTNIDIDNDPFVPIRSLPRLAVADGAKRLHFGPRLGIPLAGDIHWETCLLSQNTCMPL